MPQKKKHKKKRPLLGSSTAQQPGISKLGVHSYAVNHDDPKEKYQDCFHGLAKLKGYKTNTHIAEPVTPVAQDARLIPSGLREPVEEKMKQRMDLERVDGPMAQPSGSSSKRRQGQPILNLLSDLEQQQNGEV